MNSRVTELETTCRAAAQGSKRTHDDQDDPDQHEGESAKKQRLDSLAITTTAEATTSEVGPSEPEVQETTQQGATEQLEEARTPLNVTPLTAEEVLADSFLQSPDQQEPELEKDMSEDVLRENLQRSLMTNEQYFETLFEDDNDLVLNVEEPEPPQSPPLTEQPGDGSIPVPPAPAPQVVIPPPPARFQRIRILHPFAEETRRDLFTTRVVPTNLKVLYGIDHLPSLRRIEYLNMIKNRPKDTNEVRTNRRILEILEIGEDTVSRLWYPTFKVRREGGSIWEFAEPDLMHLEVQDLDFLYDRLGRELNKKPKWNLAYKVVKRNMKNLLRLAYLTDFQMALESEMTLNKVRPRLHLKDIKGIPPYKIWKKPEHGVVYRNFNLAKLRFLRFSEISKFSDGTLRFIQDELKARLLRHQNGRFPMDDLDLQRTEEAIQIIQERLDYREALRRFEILFGMRKKVMPEEERLAILATRRA